MVVNSKANILIVDDDPVLVDLLTDFLESKGYAIDSCLNGKDALKLCSSQEYEVALIDINLPDIDGLEVVQCIADNSPDTESILITGYASLESVLEALRQQRVVGYEVKPLDINRLQFLIQQIVDRKIAEKKTDVQQQRLTHAQKMEAIGNLAGGIAHEFNNIIGVIFGNSEMALMEDLPADSPVRYNLNQILKAASRAREVISQILTFSRKAEPNWRPEDFGAIVHDALKLIRASLPSTVEIKTGIPKEAIYVLADHTQIFQVLMNLCTNASDAMKEKGGKLEILLEEVSIDADLLAQHQLQKPGSYARLTVSDNGKGMPPIILERIFEPYFTTKEMSKGIGMGLALVHGIVKNHGGAITVYSEVEEGTTFNVMFPIYDEYVFTDTVEESNIVGGDERILLVDDEADLVEMSEQLLTRLGYSVQAETSSRKALQMFREQPDDFDLVITDQTMPRLTGIEFAGELLRLRKDIPIILCTGFSDMITPEKAKQTGIREFVMKPMTRREMADAVRRALDGS